MGNPFGRSVIVPLTNQSGGGVIAGDVVIVDTTHNDSFTTTTSAAFTGGVGVAQGTIGAGAVGLVLISGYAPLINTTASVTRGNFGTTSTTVKKAVDAGSSRGVGTFVQFLTGGTTPDGMVYPVDLLGSSLTNPMTNVGDMIVGTTAGAPARLADVVVGQVLTSGGVNTQPAWGYVPYHGCKAYKAAVQAVNNTSAAMIFDTELYDTDAIHDNVTNNTRFTIPTGMGGKWSLKGGANFSANGQWMGFYKNGATAISSFAGVPGGSGYAQVFTEDVFVAGDYIELKVSTGGTCNVGAGALGDATGWCAVTFLGA